MRTTASLSTSPFSNIACPEQWTVGAFLWIISDTASNILLHDFLLRASTINISSCKTAVLCKITPKISTTLNFSGTWAMLFSIIFTRLMVHLYARFHNQLWSFSYFLMPSSCPRKYLQVHTFVQEGILLKYENTISSEMWEQNLGSTLTFFLHMYIQISDHDIVQKSNSMVWNFKHKALKLSTFQKLQYCKIQSII